MIAGVLPGCEAVSHVAGSSVGVLAVHGFTGNPSSLGRVVPAMIDAGFDLEAPRLPGHGTTIEDMLTTGWADWERAVDLAHRRLAERTERIVGFGQSMGATLVLARAFGAGGLDAIVCVNPATRVRDAATMEMIEDFIEDGLAVVPGEGSDIADPDVVEISYPGTPLAPLRSLLVEGIAPITDRFGELTVPLRLFTSRQDHVVDPADSEHLAATYGGPVRHTWLERSYHVATRDYDGDLIAAEAEAFVRTVACS